MRLEGLCLAYSVRGGLVPAAEAMDAQFPSHTLSAIIGPSGCGKTSIVQAMAGLLAPRSGRVLVDGVELRGVRPRTAVIFQDYGLLPWKTVEANAGLPLLIAGTRARERRGRVGAILEELGLAAFAGFYPARLSGGMRQRVAIARALAAEPDLLVMDEPFSSLDAITREAMQDMLLTLQRRHGTTVVLVTHSVEEAAYLADAVYVMRGRNPGRIAARLPGSRGEARGEFRADPRYLALCVELRRALGGGDADGNTDGHADGAARVPGGAP